MTNLKPFCEVTNLTIQFSISEKPLLSSSAEVTVTPTTASSSTSDDSKLLLFNHKRGEADDAISNLLYNSVSCVMDENQTTTEQYSNILRDNGVDIQPTMSQPSPLPSTSRVSNMMRKYHKYLSQLPPAALLALANPKIGRPRKNFLSNNISIAPMNQYRTFDPNTQGASCSASDASDDPPRRKVGRPVGWRKNRDFHMQQSPAVLQHKRPAGRPKGWRKPRESLPQPMPLPLPWKGQFDDGVQKKKRGRPRLCDSVQFDPPSPEQPVEPTVSYIDDGGHFLLPS